MISPCPCHKFNHNFLSFWLVAYNFVSLSVFYGVFRLKTLETHLSECKHILITVDDIKTTLLNSLILWDQTCWNHFHLQWWQRWRPWAFAFNDFCRITVNSITEYTESCSKSPWCHLLCNRLLMYCYLPALKILEVHLIQSLWPTPQCDY